MCCNIRRPFHERQSAPVLSESCVEALSGYWPGLARKFWVLRWTAVYMAEGIALAVLENLGHMTRQDFPRGYVCVAAVLPNGTSIVQEKELRPRPALQHLST
jgi:hypothetical protein